jgi:DNA-binding NtrC family response regulator
LVNVIDDSEPKSEGIRGRPVLVVDRSEDIRWATREAFAARGVVTVQAKSVWASKIALAEYPLCAILSGILLPDGFGFELLAAARDLAPAVPVFLMSGLPYSREAVCAQGAADFFLKPFPMMEAVDAILSYCRRTGGDRQSSRSLPAVLSGWPHF